MSFFDETGTPIAGHNISTSIYNDQETSVAALDGGSVISTWTHQGLGGDIIQGKIGELVRTSNGDDDNDEIFGDALTDIVHGNGGDDDIRGFVGDDQLFGGDGMDTFTWYGGDGSDDVDGGEGYDTQYVFLDEFSLGEADTNLVLTNFADDVTFLRNEGSDSFELQLASVEALNVVGGDGNDSLVTFENSTGVLFLGDGGDDYFHGRGASDGVQLYGSWSDYRFTWSSGAYTVVDLRPGSPDGTDTYVGVEYLSLSNGDIAMADALNDAPVAAALAARTVEESEALSFDASGSFSDADEEYGDTLTFSISNAPSWLAIDAATGVVSGTPGLLDAAAARSVVVTATDIHGATASQAFSLTVTDKPDQPEPEPDPDPIVDPGTGTAGDDILRGSGGSDVLQGLAGSDKLFGLGGRDKLFGGSGKDTLDGGGGKDELNGNGGKDTLFGNSGKDKLAGGSGGDTLEGGSGKDAFIFDSLKDSKPAKKGRDKILDFNKKQRDKIDLKTIDAEKGKGNQKFDFIGEDGFSGSKGELRYEIKGKNTFVYGDTNGDGKADLAIQLRGAIDLDAGDFVL